MFQSVDWCRNGGWSYPTLVLEEFPGILFLLVTSECMNCWLFFLPTRSYFDFG
ncbi:Uncharacterized protein APZ42_000718 [Daphnia magna]|uniref:Uncharacterized protein n=1 Tax=Daphnia magna TaxID=35525 RepID=A0A164JFQ3_9CRUS|nr:Uncharacterized protein APZ42_000718 [Daphnia magna]